VAVNNTISGFIPIKSNLLVSPPPPPPAYFNKALSLS
jgi:hypothetical protein